MDLGIQIQHAGRGPEIRLKGIGRVDGIFDTTVFEFDGCWYHGCNKPECFPNQFVEDYKGERKNEMRLRREKTIDKHKAIRDRDAGYSLVTMKESGG